MIATLKIKVEVPATDNTLYAARQTFGKIVNGLGELKDIGAKYDVNAMYFFTHKLHGEPGVFEFDVRIDNEYVNESELKEMIDVMPTTHKVISRS